MSYRPQYQAVEGGEGTISRKLLPQIPKDKLSLFLKGLQDRDVKLSAHLIPASKIRPLQRNLNKDKLRYMQTDIADFENDIFLISSGNFLLDGHHRWAILKGTNKDRPIRVVRVHLPVKQALKVAHQFSETHREGQ